MEFRLKDGRAVTVRPFKPEDFEAMLAMFESLSAEALRYGLPPYDRARLGRWVSGLEGGVLLLAFDGRKVVGVAMIYGRGRTRFKGIGEFVTYIHQDYHAKGLGTFLRERFCRRPKVKDSTGSPWRLLPTMRGRSKHTSGRVFYTKGE